VLLLAIAVIAAILLTVGHPAPAQGPRATTATPVSTPSNVKPESEPGYWFCSRTAGGVISESSVRFGTKAMLPGGPVFGFDRNGGVKTARWYTKTSLDGNRAKATADRYPRTAAVVDGIRRKTTSGIGRSVREPNRPTSG